MLLYRADPEADRLGYFILACIAVFALLVLAGAIPLAVLCYKTDDADSGLIFMNDQFSFTVPKDTNASTLVMELNASEPKKLFPTFSPASQNK